MDYGCLRDLPARLTRVSISHRRKVAILALLLSTSVVPPSTRAQVSLSVFPGAEGFGSKTAAGRHGDVLRVTNLNDSGPGSLRAALEAEGPRVVIFEVSGTLTLSTDDLWIRNPYLTVAGQTAPSPGITIKGGGIRVVTHDVLIQHLRIRPGDVIGEKVWGPNSNAFMVLGPAYNVVMDHLSASWALDQNASTWEAGLRDVTFSNCLISEGLTDNALITDGRQRSMGILVGEHASNLSFLRNLMAHNVKRHPEVKGDTSTLIVNNLMYNNREELIDLYDYEGHGPHQATIVGNVHIPGPNTNAAPNFVNPLIYLNANVKPGTQVYHADNVSPRLLVNNIKGFNPIVSTPPVPTDGITVEPSARVEEIVKAHAGARPADRDAVDLRVIQEVTNRTGRIITSPGDVGGYPELASNVRPLTLPAYPDGDDDGDGYTNLEEWLHTFAAVVEGTAEPTPDPPVPPPSDPDPPAPPAPAPDVEAPKVLVTAPTAGAVVRGVVAVAAVATDNVNVVGLQIAVDGNPLGPLEASGTVTVAWNTKVVANGLHTLTAEAVDAAGNRSKSPAVTLRVDNGKRARR